MENCLGNIIDTPFDEIWFGDRIEEVRESCLKSQVHLLCQCSGCPHLKQRNLKKIEFDHYPSVLKLEIGSKLDSLQQILSNLRRLVPYLSEIHISGGEPFWKNLVFRIVDDLKIDQYQHQIHVFVETTAINLKSYKIARWLDIPHQTIICNLDASTAKTYAKIKTFPVFERVVRSLEEFSSKKVVGRQFLHLRFGLNPSNLMEAIEMLHLAKRLKADKTFFYPSTGVVNFENCGKFRRAELDLLEESKILKVDIMVSTLDMGLTEQLIL